MAEPTNGIVPGKDKYDHKKLASHFKGLSSVESAPPSAVKDFVVSHGGHTVIKSILIANNGIAAVKEIRSVRKWAYETFQDRFAISFTVMATPEDLAATSDFVKLADQVIEVPGGTNNNNYANVDLIVDVAERAKVDAVWAGWGHASENPLLPEALAASPRKIVFIGPPGSAMRSLGDKISSTIVAQHAKVPCIPWSGSGVDSVEVREDGIVSVTDEVYMKGCCSSPVEALEKAKKIGFPVMIKASEGGGGKGIRQVVDEKDFLALYQQVISEVPGSPIFVMRLAGNARHLEVQLLADQYGNNISLFGRDCSVQRRHQKIIEEAPVTIAPAETFREMENAAIRLGQLVGYVSAGTVEYLYSHADNKFYFLELNPRLQVEHPTTEMVTGVNLPAAQLQIAMGIPLHRIRDIRLLYGVDPHTTTEIDFTFSNPESLKTQRRPQPRGHCTACRITSEDPGEGFRPSSGSIQDLNFRSSSNVWGYFSVSSQSGIHSFSDSQFGHVFSFGENRTASRKNMVIALGELTVRSEFRTTTEYLIKLLETTAFEENKITTGWLDELISKRLTVERPDPMIAVLCGAATNAHMLTCKAKTQYINSLEKGQVQSSSIIPSVMRVEFIYEGIKYKFTVTKASSDLFRVFINGSKCLVGLRELSDGCLLISIDGKSHNVYWNEETDGMRLSVDGKTCKLEQESDPTQLRTTSPGKLVKYLVDNGDHVTAGQTFAEIEVMKAYMSLRAPEDGIVQLIKQPGATLEAGDILGILALDDPSKVKHAQPFEGQIPSTYGPPRLIGTKLDQVFAAKYRVLCDILNGYDNAIVMRETLNSFLEILSNPELPYAEWRSEFSASSRIPPKLSPVLQSIVEKSRLRSHKEFPAKKLLDTIDKFGKENISDKDMSAYNLNVENLRRVAESYKNGLHEYACNVICSLLEKYYEIESIFSGANTREEDAVLKLRDEKKDKLADVVEVVMSHSRVGAKNALVLAILDEVVSKYSSSDISKHFRPLLRKLVELESRGTAKVVLRAREVLIQSSLPSLEERAEQMKHILYSSVIPTRYGKVGTEHTTPSLSVLQEVIDSQFAVFDVLSLFFHDPDYYITIAALEVYARRAYRAYDIFDFKYNIDPDLPPVVSWSFRMRPPVSTVQGNNEALLANAGVSSLGRALSVSDLSFLKGANAAEPIRYGACGSSANIDDLYESLLAILETLPSSGALSISAKRTMDPRRRPVGSAEKPEQTLHNVVNVLLPSTEGFSDDELSEKFKDIIDEFKDDLLSHSVRRITFVCGHESGSYPTYFTFRGPAYVEDQSIRHIEPALAFQLELGRLSNYNVSAIHTENHNIHVYKAIGKDLASDMRYFVRAVVRTGQVSPDISPSEYLISQTNRLMGNILDTLDIIGVDNTDMNHIFINFSPEFPVSHEDVMDALGGFLERFGRRLWRLRITAAEIRIMCLDKASGVSYPLRAILDNVFGYVVHTQLYMESRTESGEWVFRSLTPDKPGPMHLRPIHTPYPAKEWLQPRRYRAHVMGTTFVYDFPELFREAVVESWNRKAGKQNSAPKDCFQAVELFLNETGELTEISREPGANDCGMVAWMVNALTPECPQGRRFIIVANDITYQIGSFGPQEDIFFNKVTELARKLGVPRIYLSANSGARIGIADELVPLFSVAWNDDANPAAGFQYLYLTPEVKEQIDTTYGKDKIVRTEEIIENGQTRHKIVTIIGKQNGLGVECLQGSGLIAGATSRAYEDIFTITLVTCRSVGIGAYLVRLGQRAIQVEGQPIILTGAAAINKLLGREVYSSNLQLGGTQIMFKNGVSHATVRDDMAGVQKIVDWLAFVPAERNAPLPIAPSEDGWDRDVTFLPPKGVYDVRHLIAGRESDNGFEYGIFDKGSFQETLSGWARTVVVGRARLGGIPFGVIGVETRSIENIIPADPANMASTEQIVQEAGQVWYPNSAFKTAQAINDFNHGEQLPLMILANWRGFSGGQRDMYNEVLKFGSFIVDALVGYKQPIFIYIPPKGELRGGSWVVVDPSINPDFMEMYADVESRAGVLEPEGMVGIKLRPDKIKANVMSRLDPECSRLKSKLEDKTLSTEEISEVKTRMAERESQLLPIYQQVALQFADLHDRSARMKAKGAITEELELHDVRRFFYWRAHRRLLEEYAYKRISAAKNGAASRLECISILKSWIGRAGTDDRAVVKWFEENEKSINGKLEGLAGDKLDRLTFEIKRLSASDREKLLQSLQ
ncbi:hypothetical protein CANCADRAFT_2313 [Tortispora caseinolytica NRRL Y-17796]|uniref:Uncharacterized protein n=1 Tax=Tortispora caseinolytica NRRL Y-17796 TaxID=767744 RepID=A0A1E4TFM8_9ASCO|nr:hypothetical protein CANCADRAFT_2313 [Tortispora caseinolytica NRRL Y-17796]